MKRYFEIWSDKIFDSLLIFVSIFFAFFFNKCQTDKMLKNELELNLSQIMRELPDKAPDLNVRWFNIEQNKNEDGTCSFDNYDFRLLTKSGVRNVDVIMSRGLSSYMKEKDRHVVGMISVYYDQILTKAINRSLLFHDTFSSDLQELSLSKKCLSDQEIEAFKKPYRKIYLEYQQARLLAETVGFEIFKKLQQMGIKKQEIEVLKFNFTMDIED